jgi:hypothetical protein
LKIDPEVPFWAHLYTLVRMGFLVPAAAYIDKFYLSIPTKDKHIKQYFHAWTQSKDGRLPKELQGFLYY